VRLALQGDWVSWALLLLQLVRVSSHLEPWAVLCAAAASVSRVIFWIVSTCDAGTHTDHSGIDTCNPQTANPHTTTHLPEARPAPLQDQVTPSESPFAINCKAVFAADNALLCM
jgi:hypothetical protein